MKLLTCFGCMSLAIEGMETKSEKETRSQNAGVVMHIHSVATWRTNGFLLMLQMFKCCKRKITEFEYKSSGLVRYSNFNEDQCWTCTHQLDSENFFKLGWLETTANQMREIMCPVQRCMNDFWLMAGRVKKTAQNRSQYLQVHLAE